MGSRPISGKNAAYEAIRSMILKLELYPGDHIAENAIAERLGQSRTPVREALRQLESEGLVTVSRNKGAQVASYTGDQVSQIGAVRLSMDMLAAWQALYHGSNAQFDQLEEYARQCDQGAASGDIYSRIETDMRFHLFITQISGNEILLKAQQSLYTKIHLIQITKYEGVESSLAQIHHHPLLVDAFRRRDGDEVTRLLCSHLGSFYSIEPYVLDRYMGK